MKAVADTRNAVGLLLPRYTSNAAPAVDPDAAGVTVSLTLQLVMMAAETPNSYQTGLLAEVVPVSVIGSCGHVRPVPSGFVPRSIGCASELPGGPLGGGNTHWMEAFPALS